MAGLRLPEDVRVEIQRQIDKWGDSNAKEVWEQVLLAPSSGARIHLLRTGLELSQRDLANRIDARVSYAYLSRLEAGTRNPSWSALAHIADSLDELMLGQRDVTGHLLHRGFLFPTECPFCHR